MQLTTPRLRLIPLEPRDLEHYRSNPAALEARLGLTLSRAVITADVQRAITVKLSRMAAAPRDRYLWYTFWLVVVESDPFGAGLAGFKGEPNALGSVEVGYGIDPACQSQGYMTEAVGALIDWAFCEPTCKRVIAETLPQNRASQRVLQKNGLKRIDRRAGWMVWSIERQDWETRQRE